MDADDFIRAAELDDVLVQVLLLRNRMKVTRLFNTSKEENEGGRDRNGIKDGSSGLESGSVRPKELKSEILERHISAALEGCSLGPGSGSSGAGTSSHRSSFPIASAVGALYSA
jgi:hypothetical protein